MIDVKFRPTSGDFMVTLPLHLYLWASAFGALTLPGSGLTYANAALPLLAVIALFAKPSLEEWIQCLLIGVAMTVDLAFREFTYGWEGVGYSINIGKIALFILVASRFASLPDRTKWWLVVSFGLAAISSEVFAVLNPEYRLALFNAESIAEGFGFDLFRPTGLIGDPNYFALPLSMMAVAAYLLDRKGLLLLAILFVIASGSRSAAIATLLPIFVLQMSRSSHRPMKMVAVALIYFGGALTVAAVNQILRDNTGSESTEERLGLLIQGIQNIASLSFLESTYGEPLAHALDGQLLVIHNTFLQTLSTSLLLGGFFILRTIRGFLAADALPLLLCLVIEMMFLDLSSQSSFVLLFLLFTVAARRSPAAPRFIHDQAIASHR